MIHHISKLESKNNLKKNQKLECSALYILFSFCLAESIHFQSYLSQHIITLSPKHCQTHFAVFLDYFSHSSFHAGMADP